MAGPGCGRIQFAVVDQATNNLNKMEEYISAGMETAIDIGHDLITNNTSPDKTQLEELKETMVDYCRMDRDLRQFLKAMDFVKKEAAKMGPEQCAELEQLLDDRIGTLAEKNSDEELCQHEKYIELMDKLTADVPDEEPEAASTGPEVDESGEVAVTQQDVKTKCPYTMLEMQNPVCNKHCGHNYERAAITQFIKSRKKGLRCPVSGCINENPLSLDDLEDNKELKRFIEKKNRAVGKRSSKKK